MDKFYFLGECMVELRATEPSTMQQAFAGDVYNSAVYLKRSFPAIEAGMLTAIGKDGLSEKMLAEFTHHGLDCRFVFQHLEKVPGLYLIETDDTGERHFTYWRNDSAARKVMDFITPDTASLFTAGDSLFFSGISIAVLDESGRERLWKLLAELKTRGVRLIFDPNYRARLWSSPQQAASAFMRALELADVALPGVEDLTALFDIQTPEAAIAFCRPFNLTEVVIKNGPHSVVTCDAGHVEHHDITPVKEVVDTTSAGDAFNGVYLGARANGASISDAVQLAATAAGTVIQHPGAIIPLEPFKSAMKSAGL